VENLVKVKDYEVPEDLYYHKEYLWVRKENGSVRIGLTDFSQKQLRDIVYTELPAEGDEITQNDPFGTLESVKAVSDLIAPISGKVETVNEKLESNPELINEDPYGEGWLVVVAPTNLEVEIQGIMNFEAAVQWHKELAEES
jgi:glycine cleavage system H protein